MVATFPKTVEELEAAVDNAMQQRWKVEGELAVARMNVAPWEGMGDVANLPPNALQAKQKVVELTGAAAEAKAEAEDLVKRLREKIEEEVRANREDRDFWFRRFMVSLQIGNGAAFVAAISAVLHGTAKEMSLLAVLVWAPTIYFGIGVIASGLLPLGMAARQALAARVRARKAAYIATLFLTTTSAGAFILGIGSVAVEVTQLQQPAISAAHQAAIRSQGSPQSASAGQQATRAAK